MIKIPFNPKNKIMNFGLNGFFYGFILILIELILEQAK